MLPAIAEQSATVPQSTDKTAPALKITRKVRAAIDGMVWEGLNRADAAQRAGLKDNSLYVALTRPDVKRYYLQQCDVLRLSGRARRIHRLEAIVEQDENKQAAVNACRALDGHEDTAASMGYVQRQPGVTIVINSGPMMAQDQTEAAKPLIEHGPSSGDGDA